MVEVSPVPQTDYDDRSGMRINAAGTAVRGWRRMHRAGRRRGRTGWWCVHEGGGV